MAGHADQVPAEPPLTVGDLAQLLGFLLGTSVILVLIGQDLRNAIKKGATWVPGYALVLGALTIQAMNFVENQGALLNQMMDGPNSQPLNAEIVKNNLFMVHSSRVMLCVLVAFFLPGMARPGYQETWTKIIALGLSVFLDIFSELLSVRRHLRDSGLYLATYFISIWPHARQVDVVSFIVSGAIISFTLIWLVVLLICASLASKSIRNLTHQRILYVLGKPEEDTWKALEDQILKSWIVALACHPESIIASSVLAASAAFGVTACILSSIVGWIVQGPAIKILDGAGFWLKFIITIMQVIFILIGWAIVGWRWLTAAAYYGAYHGDEEQSKRWNSRRYFDVEDFWTRHIVELLEAEELKLRELKVNKRISKIFTRKLKNLKVDDRDVSIMTSPEVKKKMSLKRVFLLCVFWFQWLVVFLSKAYSFLTDITLYNKLSRWLVESTILKKHLEKVRNDYVKDKNIMKNVRVLWQTPKSVFSTNRKSIRQAKKIMAKGNKDGESCHVLITLLQKYKARQTHVDIECLDPGSAPQSDLNFLCRVKNDDVLAAVDVQAEADMQAEYLNARKRTWKLTAVSLIYIIFRLSPQSERVARDCLQVYYEAWELMDMVESEDPENNFPSKAADSLFNALTKTIEEAKAANQRMEETEPANQTLKSMKEAEEAIQTLAKECKGNFDKVADMIHSGKDSPVDWENLVAWNALYRLCMSIDCSSGNISDLRNELDNSLADIIGGCLSLVGQALVDRCRTWAQDLDNMKLVEALYVAGKSRGLMERVDEVPKVQTYNNVRKQLEEVTVIAS